MRSSKLLWVSGILCLVLCVALGESMRVSRGIQVAERRISKNESDLKDVRRDVDRLVGHFEAMEQSADRILEMLAEMRDEMRQIKKELESK